MGLPASRCRRRGRRGRADRARLGHRGPARQAGPVGGHGTAEMAAGQRPARGAQRPRPRGEPGAADRAEDPSGRRPGRTARGVARSSAASGSGPGASGRVDVGRLPGRHPGRGTAGAASDRRRAARLRRAAALAGSADWSEQHEQQMRVGVVHAAANSAAITLYLGSLLARSRRRTTLGKVLGFAGLAAVTGRHAGRDIYRLACGANHAEEVPHLVPPGWHDLMALAQLEDGKPVRVLLGEVPVLARRDDEQVHVLADKRTCPVRCPTGRSRTDASPARGTAARSGSGTARWRAAGHRRPAGLRDADRRRDYPGCLPGAGRAGR